MRNLHNKGTDSKHYLSFPVEKRFAGYGRRRDEAIFGDCMPAPIPLRENYAGVVIIIDGIGFCGMSENRGLLKKLIEALAKISNTDSPSGGTSKVLSMASSYSSPFRRVSGLESECG